MTLPLLVPASKTQEGISSAAAKGRRTRALLWSPECNFRGGRGVGWPLPKLQRSGGFPSRTAARDLTQALRAIASRSQILRPRSVEFAFLASFVALVRGQSLHVRSISARGNCSVSSLRRRARDATCREISFATIQQKTNSADRAHQVSIAFNKKCHTAVSHVLPRIIRLRDPAAGRDRRHGSACARCAPRPTAEKSAAFVPRNSHSRCSTRCTNLNGAESCHELRLARCIARWSRRSG